MSDDAPLGASPEATPTVVVTPPAPGEPTATATFGPGPPPAPGTVMPGPDVTPEPGATPDITQPYWSIPWRNQDRMKPLFDGTIAGIRIGNGVSGPAALCDGELTYAGPEAVEGSSMNVLPSQTPRGTSVLDGRAVLCDGEPFGAEVTLNVATDIELRRFGGTISISRWYGAPFASVAIAEDRWLEMQVGGQLVAVAVPILPDLGLGSSAVVAHDGEILTLITGSGIELDDLLLVADGVFGEVNAPMTTGCPQAGE